MRKLLTLLALLAGVAPVLAQTTSSPDAERARIASERTQAEALFAAKEVACYRKFAVNDCLNAARAERRERLSDLRRQELTLNDEERKRKAGERLRIIEERNLEKKQEEGAAQRAESLARFRERQAEMEKRAAERARKQASAAAATASAPAAAAAGASSAAPQSKDSSRTPKAARPHDAAEELRRYNERQQEAKERRERVARRLAEQRKPEVKPLPVPP